MPKYVRSCIHTYLHSLPACLPTRLYTFIPTQLEMLKGRRGLPREGPSPVPQCIAGQEYWWTPTEHRILSQASLYPTKAQTNQSRKQSSALFPAHSMLTSKQVASRAFHSIPCLLSPITDAHCSDTFAKRLAINWIWPTRSPKNTRFRGVRNDPKYQSRPILN